MKTLLEIHEDVPADHYDSGIKNNYFQKFWHWRRFNEVLGLITSEGGKFLDVGCHSGLFTEKVVSKLKPTEVHGIDVSKSAILKAKKRVKMGNFQVADAHKLPFKSNYFDVVICLEMLEHVDNPVKVMSEIYRVMKKGGYGIVLVPSDNILFKFVWFLWNIKYPVWKHAHVQSFQNSSLENLVKTAGFKISKHKTFNAGMLKVVKFTKI